MVDRGVYTLRGWLAFVAFLDFAQALRSYRDKDVFLGSYMCNRTDGAFNCTEATKLPVPTTAARLLIFYSVQNVFVLLICAFCIHHWPMVLMTAVSVVLKIAYLVLESLKFKSSPFSFHIIYPVIVHGLTLIALSFSSKLLRKEIMNHHENEEILKMCNGKPIYLPTRKKKKV